MPSLNAISQIIFVHQVQLLQLLGLCTDIEYSVLVLRMVFHDFRRPSPVTCERRYSVCRVRVPDYYFRPKKLVTRRTALKSLTSMLVLATFDGRHGLLLYYYPPT